MPRSVKYSTHARWQLLEINTYITQENPAAAQRVAKLITDSVDGLLDFPMLDKPWIKTGTRKLVLSKYPYSIIYKLTPEAVFILAIDHQSLR
jgi:plasmid stabilization system protein ParE